MPITPVVFIDTSVLLNILAVPGMCADSVEVKSVFRDRVAAGVKFVLPVTTVIETGNHVANCSGDRRSASVRYTSAINAARASDPPWTIRDVNWGEEFLADLVNGASTGSDLLSHLSAGTMGAGDLSILVERDQFVRDSAFSNVQIWTLDRRLAAYADCVSSI